MRNRAIEPLDAAPPLRATTSATSQCQCRRHRPRRLKVPRLSLIAKPLPKVLRRTRPTPRLEASLRKGSAARPAQSPGALLSCGSVLLQRKSTHLMQRGGAEQFPSPFLPPQSMSQIAASPVSLLAQASLSQPIDEPDLHSASHLQRDRMKAGQPRRYPLLSPYSSIGVLCEAVFGMLVFGMLRATSRVSSSLSLRATPYATLS